MSGVLAELDIRYPEMHDPVMSDGSKPKDFYYGFKWDISEPKALIEDPYRSLTTYRLALLKKNLKTDQAIEQKNILVIGEFDPQYNSQLGYTLPTIFYRVVYMKFREKVRSVDNIHEMQPLQLIVQQTINSYADNLKILYQDDYTFEDEMVITDTKIKWEVLSRLSNIISSMLTQKGFKTIYSHTVEPCSYLGAASTTLV